MRDRDRDRDKDRDRDRCKDGSMHRKKGKCGCWYRAVGPSCFLAGFFFPFGQAVLTMSGMRLVVWLTVVVGVQQTLCRR